MTSPAFVQEYLRERESETDPRIQAALKQERLEIARMLHAEARKYEEAAKELRADYDDAEDEAFMNEQDADLINRLADLILARTPVVAANEAPEIAF